MEIKGYTHELNIWILLYMLFAVAAMDKEVPLPAVMARALTRKKHVATGIDISVEKLQEIVEGFRFFDTGYGNVVSYGGVIVAHLNKEIVGKSILDSGDKQIREKELSAIKAGKVYHGEIVSSKTKAKSHFTTVPIYIGKAPTPPWAFVMSVPMDEILSSAKILRNTIIGITIGGMIILVIFIIVISNSISNSIKELLAAISDSFNEIADTIEEHERTTMQQSAAVTQTSSTIEELGVSSQQSSEQSDMAATEAQQVSNLALQGVEQSNIAREAMANLREKVMRIAKQILQLSEQTSQIGSVTSIVSPISQIK